MVISGQKKSTFSIQIENFSYLLPFLNSLTTALKRDGVFKLYSEI